MEHMSDTKAEQTKQLLMAISYHLSRNILSKGDEYLVAIGVRDPFVPSSISFNLEVDDSIFLDTLAMCCHHHNGRRSNVKQPAIQHIIGDHFPELSKGSGHGGQMYVDMGKLEPGVYQYKRSTSNKCRRWFRVR